ncbi:hypothetical protein [Saccharibacillus sp. JS10]|uniref:hypothetical protein n=1 Tax=Saccharibacillus sp. JS10 TaxID=2950552 RepID=UPI0021087493|nr:hypothetical protein [Saccharibacillus sp. JS10]MCQ4085949.1 hypothetical protein [Saccharibacillus sp. JS10]
MENLRKKVKARISLLTVLIVVVTLVYIAFMMYRSELPILNSFAKGFHYGIFIGLELVLIGFLVTNIRSLRSEETLKKMHIQETDERVGLIIQKTATTTIWILFALLGIATVIAGFMNAVIFFTLLAVLLGTMFLFYGAWGYFAKQI